MSEGAPSRTASVLSEPLLRFGFGQALSNPKEGLFLFGPLREHRNPTEIRCGVIGTPSGAKAYRSWVERIARPVSAAQDSTTSVFFPGFRELFSCAWPTLPIVDISISAPDLAAALHKADRHEAVHAAVSIFSDQIQRFVQEDDRIVDLWFVVIPDEVFELGRPKSRVPTAIRVQTAQPMNARLARKLRNEPSLFREDMEAAKPYEYEVDFHNQLKARLIKSRAITQVVRESTLGMEGKTKRRMQDSATIAWNLSVSSFYKAGGRPWRLRDVREGVCYLGLVFKRDSRGQDEGFACCGAQMFLTSGEGMVFKGSSGTWYYPATKEFHLSRDQAESIGTRAIRAYIAEVGRPPNELFIHGRTRFDDQEWSGFEAAMPETTALNGVRISRSDEFKLYRPGRMPVIRGTTVFDSRRVAYLWTSGFTPELGTYPGWEVPNPLRVELCRGDASLETVVSDVFSLTKLNFNSCIYSDGLPVTLRFADSIGEILTAAPAADIPEAPLPFRHYI